MQCFTGGHLPLALLAMIVLALCALLIPMTVLLLLKNKPVRLPYVLERMMYFIPKFFLCVVNVLSRNNGCGSGE